MKKLLSLLMAMLICASIFASAMAEPTLICNGKNIQWINGTNLLRIEGSEGYGMADMDGNVLTDMLYTSFYYNIRGRRNSPTPPRPEKIR